MPKLKTIDQHLAISLSEDVQQICRPLWESTDVSFFNFVRIFDDGRRLSVGNRGEWLKHYFDHQYQDVAIFQNTPSCYNNKIILWDGCSSNIPMAVAGESFDISHGMTLIDKREEGYGDFLHFATERKNHHIINTYVNQLDFFYQFKIYFMEQAKEILKKPKPYEPIDKTHSPAPFLNIQADKLDNRLAPFFFDQFPVKHYSIEGFLGLAELSSKEMACLILCGKRFTAKEIGRLFKLSHRTIEGHMARLKEKLGCKSLWELRQIAEKLI